MLGVRIVPLTVRSPRHRAGGKARGLQRLLDSELSIPATWVLPWVRERSLTGHRRGQGPRLRRALASLLDPDKPYAIRSSAEIEDGQHRSQAGRFLTVLHVRGIDPLIEAIARVRASGSSGRERMGVIIQEMVESAVSGVVFSRNPVTWADEAVIEAVAGTSEALTQGTASPHRWTIRNDSVQGDGALPGLPRGTLVEIAETARRMAAGIGYDLDLEWAFDGQRLLWLQLRPMTAIRPSDVYSNRFSREYLPGLILPLVWEINIPMVNGAWLRLLGELIGPIDLAPERLAERIGCRAYFNMGRMGDLFAQAGLPRDLLESLMGFSPGGAKTSRFRPTLRMARHTPRVVRLLASILRYPRHWPAWFAEAQSRLGVQSQRAESLVAPAKLLQVLDETRIWMSDLAYHRIVTMLMHAVAHRRTAQRLRRQGIEAPPGDMLPPDVRLTRFDPGPSLDALRRAFRALSAEEQALVVWPTTIGSEQHPQIQAFFHRFETLMDTFGYLCDSGNDFSSPRWREIPERVLRWTREPETCREIRSGKDPEPTSKRLRRSLHRLSDARFHREATGALFTQAHDLLRTVVRRVGDALVEAQRIDQADDVFYLETEEIRAALGDNASSDDLRARVHLRREEMADAQGLVLPETIYGDGVPEVSPSVRGEAGFVGVPASRGIYTGPACVVRSSEDFERLQSGDVLVIPFSDVGWTALVLRASAVVAEAGGMLSHAAIVAREAGIPAVGSVANACSIPHGTLIRVDGAAGQVTPSGANASAGDGSGVT